MKMNITGIKKQHKEIDEIESLIDIIEANLSLIKKKLSVVNHDYLKKYDDVEIIIPEKSNVTIANMKYYTVKQFIEKYPFITLGGLRHLIFHSEYNGMDSSGVLKRLGRKILIDSEKYFAWMEKENNNPKGCAYNLPENKI